MRFFEFLLTIFFFIRYSISIREKQDHPVFRNTSSQGSLNLFRNPERGVSMRKVRKLFSVLLSILLIAGMMPMAAGAAGPDGATEAVSQIVYSGEEVSVANDRV